jgi:hypothetical protein
MVEDYITARLRPQVYNVARIKTLADRLAQSQELEDLYQASKLTGHIYRRGEFGKALFDLSQLIRIEP